MMLRLAHALLIGLLLVAATQVQANLALERSIEQALEASDPEDARAQADAIRRALDEYARGASRAADPEPSDVRALNNIETAILSAVSPAFGEQTGFAVAVDEGIAAVGSPGAGAGEVHIYVRNLGGADQWSRLTTLTGLVAGDRFGHSLGLSDGRLVVGAPNATVGGMTGAGEAYLFERNLGGADNWGLVTTLSALGPMMDDRFAHAVDISGDVVVVGIPQRDNIGAGNNDQGSVAVFDRNEGGADNWGLLREILDPDNGPDARLGHSVSIDGLYAVAGREYIPATAGGPYDFTVLGDMGDGLQRIQNVDAPADATGAGFGSEVAIDELRIAASGAEGGNRPVHIFEASLGSSFWQESARIPTAVQAVGDQFGHSLSLSGRVLTVGSPESGAGSRGLAFQYERDLDAPNDWTLVDIITGSPSNVDDYTSFDVASDSSALVLGAPEVDLAGTDFGNGSAYLFVRDGSTITNGRTVRAPQPLENAAFGYATAISGDTAVVTALNDDTRYSEGGSAWILQRDLVTPGEWEVVTRLVPSMGNRGALFGYSADIDGDTVVVGARVEDPNTFNGAAYVFERNQGGPDAWGEVTRLTNSTAFFVDQFGISVSVSGDTIAVGAATHFHMGTQQGAAYIFERDLGGPDAWGERTEILASDAMLRDEFGRGVALDGDTLVVGAARVNDGAVDAGAFYVYERDLGGMDNWGERIKVVPPALVPDARAGFRVALNGDVAVIGASNPFSGDTPGSVYVFERDIGGADAWGLSEQLFPSNSSVGDFFGLWVAAGTDLVAGGAVGGDLPGTDNGTVFVFERPAPRGGPVNWVEAQAITANGPETNAFFGRSLDFDGDSLLIGASNATVNGIEGVGEVQRFDRNGSWSHQQTIVPTLPNDNVLSLFGESVDIDGRWAVIGAPDARNTFNEQTGLAYLFYRDPDTNSWIRFVTLNSDTLMAGDRFGETVSISGNTIAVGAPNTDNLAGATYLFARTGASDVWAEIARLTASDADPGDRFGEQVSVSDGGGRVAVSAPLWDDPAFADSGAVYLFDQSNGGFNAWGETQQVTGTARLMARFGHALHLDNDRMAVGAPDASNGFVTVFERNLGGADNWGQVIELPGSVANQRFGFAVAIDDQTLAITDGQAQPPMNGLARLYIHQRNAGGVDQWGQTNNLSAGGQAGDGTGHAIDVDGERIVYTRRNFGNSGFGNLFLRERNRGGADTWGFGTILGIQGLGAGSDVAIDGEQLVFGEARDLLNGMQQGAATLFEYLDRSVLSYANNNVSVSEGDGTVTVTVNRSAPLFGRLVVNWSLLPQTATAGDDYVVDSGQLIWETGDGTSRDIVISIVDDNDVELAETFQVRGQLITGEALFNPNVATVTIEDNEDAGEVEFLSALWAAFETEPMASVRAARSGGSDGIATIDFSTVDDTAIAGVDYVATNGTLTWQDGETGFKIINIPLLPPTPGEPTEEFQVQLSNPSLGLDVGALDLTTNQIVAVNQPGTVSLTMTDIDVNDTDSMVTVEIERTGFAEGAASLNLTTMDGTAVAGDDYTAADMPYNWADLETGSRSLMISLPADNGYEGDEFFTVAMTNASGVTLGQPTSATINILETTCTGELSLNASQLIVDDSDPMVTVNVQRTTCFVSDIGVSYRTLGDTATAGQDFVPTTGTLSWADGDTAIKSFDVLISPDAGLEGTESFIVEVFNPTGGATLGALNSVPVYIFERSLNEGFVQRLRADDPSFLAQFATAVDLDGNQAIFGARNRDSGGMRPGAAYIFDRSGGRLGGPWSQSKLLEIPAPMDQDSFGQSAAISGDIAVVGAPGRDSGGADAGSAFLFGRDVGGAGNWGLIRELVPSQLAPGDRYGISVAADGDWVMVGADHLGGSGEGAVFAFERDTGGADNWGESTIITSGAGANGNFGFSLSLQVPRLAVGNPEFQPGGSGATGTAYLFDRDIGGANNWGLLDQVNAPLPTLLDEFGYSVDVDGDALLVGARNRNDIGTAYVYTFDGLNYNVQARLDPPEGAQFDSFGWAVAIADGRALVGALDDDDRLNSTGAVYRFDQDAGGAGNWGFIEKFLPDVTTAEANLGNALDLEGTRGLIGSLNDRSVTISNGAAFEIDLSPQSFGDIFKDSLESVTRQSHAP